MSLYGNVKKIASSTFQFDRVYHTRFEMDDNCATDGVYAGRYVLINYGQDIDTGYYGQRYEKIDNAVNVTDNGYNIRETDIYRNNRQTDETHYGTTYDSTVWQKIYSHGESGEKYIMVAELNALAPQFELVLEKPLLYQNVNDVNSNNPSNTVTASQVYVVGLDSSCHTAAIKLKNTYENVKQPSFDLVHSNELAYYLHLPKPVDVNLANENIYYNKDGFDQVYSVPHDSNPDSYNSFIVWTPDGLNKNDISSGNSKEVDKKSLHINLPNFGNLMQDLYDLVYGIPEANDPAHVRPFFKNGWTQAGNVNITTDNPEGELRTIENDTNRSWVAQYVPTVGEVLANNTEGLMGVLSALFCEKDPLTGTIRYYLKTDWTNYYDYDHNTPFIDNKPKIIGYTQYKLIDPNASYSSSKIYYTIDETSGRFVAYRYINADTWSADKANEKIYTQSYSDAHYKVDYDSWNLQYLIS